MATATLREAASFLRWRLVPVRKLGKIRKTLARPNAVPRADLRVDEARLAKIERDGFALAAPLPDGVIKAIQEVYLPRGEAVVARATGHPFENIMRGEDFNADNPVFQLAFSDAILGAAQAYFDGRFMFDSIQVLQSFPTEGPLRASQYWHRDYGDSRSLHFVMYVNDVTDDAGGPFGFVDKSASLKVRRSPFIRRLTDDQIASEIGHDRFETFYGKAGDAVLIDPAVCYHYGSRCKTPRTAVFITFNSNTPYTGMMEPLSGHRAQAAQAARQVRPDLPGEFIDAILQV